MISKVFELLRNVFDLLIALVQFK